MTEQTTSRNDLFQTRDRRARDNEKPANRGARIRIAAIAFCALCWASVIYWMLA